MSQLNENNNSGISVTKDTLGVKSTLGKTFGDTHTQMHTLLTADRRRCDLVHVTVLLLLESKFSTNCE